MSINELGQPGSQSNRISGADALAFFIKDSIGFGRWIMTPGLRIESIDFLRTDYGKNDPDRTGDNLLEKQNSATELLPGIGLGYALSSRWNVFGGVHKGFAPPGPGQDPVTKPEESWNYELGVRFTGEQSYVDAALF